MENIILEYFMIGILLLSGVIATIYFIYKAIKN